MSAATSFRVSPPTVAAVALTGSLGLASAMGIGRFAFTPLLPLMQRHGQIDMAQGAWLAIANYLGYLLGALACARWPPSPVAAARAGLLGVAVFTWAMGAGGNLESWLAWRLLAGAASALALIGFSAWTLQTLALAGRPAWAGAVFAGVGAGIALAGWVCLEAVRLNQTPDRIWGVLGLLATLAMLLAWPRLSAMQGTPAPRSQPVSRVLDARGWRLIMAYGAYGFGYILPATFLPAMARQYFVDPSRFGVVWPSFGLAALASTLLTGWLAREFGPRTVWIAAQLVMAIGVGVPALSHSLLALLLSAVCVGGTFMVITMAAMQQARQFAGTGSSRLMAAMTAAFAAGQLLGPLTVAPLASGALAAREAVPMAASIIAFGALAVGIVLLIKPVAGK